MNLIVFDPEFKTETVVDTYDSLQWSQSYQSSGSFEIYTRASQNIIEVLAINNYVICPIFDNIMVVETHLIETDIEQGDWITISGRSLESILTRRILWEPVEYQGYTQNFLKKLIVDAFISPTINERKINNLIFRDSIDPSIVEDTIPLTEYRHENLNDIYYSIINAQRIGFKITLEENTFVAQLYFGKNRSYSQNENPFVVFSPEYDNLLSSNIINSTKDLINVCLVDSTSNDTVSSVYDTGINSSGINRRESYTTEYSEDEHELNYKGFIETQEHSTQSIFEGTVDMYGSFKYGVDFFLGDIIQYKNEYGMSTGVRLSEVTLSEGPDGYFLMPIFVAINEEVA